MSIEPGSHAGAAIAGRGHLRCSTLDREQVVEVLKAAFVQDRLSKDEFEARIGRALAVLTCAELAAVIADIPAGLVGARPARPPARTWGRLSMNQAITTGACVMLAGLFGMVAALLSGSAAAVVVVALLFVVATPLAIWAMIVAR
ncbi:MAG TPA: DUF1707 domain-containing protein [Streptosporangiaceae bacterium]